VTEGHTQITDHWDISETMLINDFWVVSEGSDQIVNSINFIVM